MSWLAFFDDAAIFPPGNAPLDAAVARHIELSDSSDGALLGPFICPASRLDELCHLLGHRNLTISLIANTDHTADVLTVVAGLRNLTLASVELPLGLAPIPVDGATLAIERRWDDDWQIPDGAVLKLRCGGSQESDVPGTDAMASAIQHCVSTATPFKLTAGLHQAVRGIDPHTGFTHHGFLNIAVGVQRALSGHDVLTTLASTDGPALATEFLAGPPVRDLFRSIGTCDTMVPIRDLHTLQLIDDRQPA